MDFGLKNKTAIIGGSSKGLGKACAVALAREGANIVLCARGEDALLQTQRELEAMGAAVLALRVDMSCREDNKRVVSETLRRFGSIDILVNNSGGPKPGTFRDISDEDWDTAYRDVLQYVVRMTQLCVPHMEKNGWGRIINITSISVKEPMSDMVLSNVFRTGVVSFAKTISRELIRHGITVNNVSPGYFRTERLEQLLVRGASQAGVSQEEYEKQKVADFPHGRYMDAQELGDLVCYLCSENAKSITGTTLQIDGGLMRGLM